MFWWVFLGFGINTRTINSLFVLDDKYFSLPTLVGVFYTVFHDIIFKGAWFTMDKIKNFKQKEKQIVIFQRVKIWWKQTRCMKSILCVLKISFFLLGFFFKFSSFFMYWIYPKNDKKKWFCCWFFFCFKKPLINLDLQIVFFQSLLFHFKLAILYSTSSSIIH